MNRDPRAFRVAAVLLLLSGSTLTACGTMTKGDAQKITITSIPEGAEFVASPSGKRGVTPAEIKLERRFDHTIEFSYPGYETRRMYVRRTIASGPQWGNVGSCMLLPFICMAFSGFDEASGGEFNLVPATINADLRPGSDPERTPEQSRVTFFNGNHGSPVTFSIDGGEECTLNSKQYTIRVLPAGHHEVDAFHWDVFKMTGKSPLDLDGADLYVAIYSSVYSTRAAFANDLPSQFQETCAQKDPSNQTSTSAAPSQ